LFGNNGGAHTPLSVYRQIFSYREYHDFYKFTFVRNPWDRLASAYFYLRTGGNNISDRIFAEKHILPYRDINQFVMEWLDADSILKATHFIPQHRFLTVAKDKIDMDFIGRFENIEKDFEHVCKRLEVNISLPHSNKSRTINTDYRKTLSAAAADKIAKLYSKDIELFNYVF
jgi:hypothetical protein